MVINMCASDLVTPPFHEQDDHFAVGTYDSWYGYHFLSLTGEDALW